MANKVTPELVEKMVSLYQEIGTYSGVAVALGVSPSTVSRYLKRKDGIKTYNDYSGAEPIEFPEKESVRTFSILSDTEEYSYKKFVKEYWYVF